MKAKRTYERGAFARTVRHTATDRLYVRKAVMRDGKQRQIWRVCEPETQKRVDEILREIEAEILSGGGDKSDVELAKIFLKVQAKEIGFDDFKKTVKTIG